MTPSLLVTLRRPLRFGLLLALSCVLWSSLSIATADDKRGRREPDQRLSGSNPNPGSGFSQLKSTPQPRVSQPVTPAPTHSDRRFGGDFGVPKFSQPSEPKRFDSQPRTGGSSVAPLPNLTPRTLPKFDPQPQPKIGSSTPPVATTPRTFPQPGGIQVNPELPTKRKFDDGVMPRNPRPFGGVDVGKLNPQPDIPGRKLDPKVVDRGKFDPKHSDPKVTLPKINPPGRSPELAKPQLDRPGRTVLLPGADSKIFAGDRSPGGKKIIDFGPKLAIPSTPLRIDKNGKLPKVPDLKLDGLKFADRLKSGSVDRVALSSTGRRLDLNRQFHLLHDKGDVARQLSLHQKIAHGGGWRKAAKSGPLSKNFVALHFGGWCGGGVYPSWCWFPKWSHWVDWCWWDVCNPICDPRPYWCIPSVYDPCPSWVYWEYPVWEPLYVTTCGTWVDVPVIAMDEGLDLQLLAVRFVDSGHPDKNWGPRYRAWFRNSSKVDIAAPFNVLLMASNDREPQPDLPQAGVRVETIKAGEVQAVDIRLPIDVMQIGRDAMGRSVPFSQLHVLVDSHQEVPEVYEKNNGVVIARTDVLPVDPAAFSTDATAIGPGQVLNIAGEGFGPEPGQVVVFVKGVELQAEIQGWFDLGACVKTPTLTLDEPTAAEVLVVRGDGAAANTLPVTFNPVAVELPPTPEGP